ncbi:recombinase family protein [Rhizobium leguminosarum]|uniref:recombinase family protein n=1 Tax=Rhizobium ruizarguesonis TaxID=2081791 RepID=UPI0013BAF463|nr:recombinase family protein [Rhizobium ruizarguesonis]NEH87742.1 recombinase family protein [Rhizobium ruizarguesonis]NEJ60272.1 recombinase family protein [Rhizobium ruizarguesonis]NEJ67348.1 recombinase family protein [Rhizobium ruizarguesonis]NEK04296.1 recombinase family protein [Rhizobium ruizarguesonis]
MKRAVIYARYSTDLQNDKSVEDQFSLCRDFAARLGAEVVKQYSDRAKSGASMFGRPGLADMMTAAERGDFEILVTESTDRVSRDIADLAHVHKVLKFRNIEMQCVNGGLMDTVQIGMYGIVGQMQREEGARKVKRGMTGVVRSGRNAGGKAYGYRPVTGRKGELEIVEYEANVVRRVFDMYVAGISPRSIASTLNHDAVPAPRGKQWNASTIHGNDRRGNGILRNPLYVGKLVWNRVQMIKDPSTGKRVSRANDEDKVETIDAPHLRIVDEELFQAAKDRLAARGGSHAHHAPRNKRLLSGLLKCGACGGGLATVGSDRSGPRVMCSTYRESHSCSNYGKYYVEKIERDVVDRLRRIFADTSYIDAYVEEYRAESKRIAADRRTSRGAKESALENVQRQIERVIEQVSKGTIEEEDVLAILPGLKAKRAALRTELDAEHAPTNVIEIKPRAVTKFKEDLESLAKILEDRAAEPTLAMATAFREVVSGVIVHPRIPGEPYSYEIKGLLAGIAGPELSAVLLVAEEGFEPPTQGL